MRMCVHLVILLLALVLHCGLGDCSLMIEFNSGKQYCHLKHFLMSSLGFIISTLIFALFVVYGRNPKVSKTIMMIQFIEGGS